MTERELFLAALDISDPAKRQAYLQDACADNPELLSRVESLLASHEDQSQFLETPVVEQLADEPDSDSSATVLVGRGSSQQTDDELDVFAFGRGSQTTEFHDDSSDEVTLGYLEPSSREDSLGRLGHYEVLEVVGSGAFGTVLKAFDEKLQRVVAIKVLSPEMASTSPARKRFLREARSSAAVRHDNVVSIYAVEDEPIPYLVMEYIPGQTLKQRLDGTGPLDIEEVLRIGKQIADGLAAAHAQDLIHRDIKPGNILLDTSVDDHVKITDFGLARTADDASMTQSGMIAGTPLYMAPEQALGQKLDQRADLFSFGSVLYQMLSGRPPFRAPNTVAVLKRVVEDAPRSIQEIIPEVPQWACELIGHLHAKDPDRRYSSAKEVSEIQVRCLSDVEAGRRPKIPAPVTAETVMRPAHAQTSNQTRIAAWRTRSSMLAAICLVLCALGFTEATGVTRLTSTVIRLTSGSGTLVIETDDPGLKIAVDGKEVTITGGGVEELTLRPGDYQVAALRDGQPVKQELVSIIRNGRTVVRMRLETPGGENPVVSAKLPGEITDGNYALSFDGRDDYVEVPTLKHVDGSPITVEAICRIVDLNRSTLVDFGNRETSEFVLRTDAQQWRFERTSGSKLISTRGSQGFEPDAFVHIAGVWDGSQLRLFINGVLQPGSNDSSTSRQRTQIDRLLIGGLGQGRGQQPAPPMECFGGAIKALRISNTARYTSRFTAAGGFEPDEHTLALYHFGEGQGDVLRDVSGHGHHGKIVGATWMNLGGGAAKTELASGQPIDLIELLEPTRDFRDDRLKIRDGKLVTPQFKMPGAIGMIPYGPVPDEYDIELRLQRLSNYFAGFNLGIVVGGRQVCVGMDCGYKEKVWGLDFLDGIAAHRPENPTRNPGRRLIIGQTSDVTIQVRKNRVTVSCDGETLVDWTGNPERLSVNDGFGVPVSNSLFFVAQADFIVHKMRLIPRGTVTSERTVTPSLSFDGVDDYVATPFSYDGSTPLTIEATVQMNEWPDKDWAEIVSNTHKGGVSLSASRDGFNFSVHDGDEYVNTLVPRDDRFLNRPVKLAGVVGLDTIRFFVDGKLTDEEPLTAIHSSEEKFSLGTSPGYGQPNDGHEFEWQGQLLEVRISNYPWYIADYDATKPLTPSTHALALYRFDEGRGDVLMDSSGSGHHGKIVGAKWVQSVSAHSEASVREFASNEWIDVLPLIDLQFDDREIPGQESRAGWRITSTAIINAGDDLASQLKFPLDSEWKSYECELEVSLIRGNGEIGITLPNAESVVPLIFNSEGKGGIILFRTGRKMTTHGFGFEPGQRRVVRFEVFRRAVGDTVKVYFDGEVAGSWSGTLDEVKGGPIHQDYPQQRQLTLWTGGKGEFAFHRIRVRTLDGGTARTLRPMPERRASQ